MGVSGNRDRVDVPPHDDSSPSDRNVILETIANTLFAVVITAKLTEL